MRAFDVAWTILKEAVTPDDGYDGTMSDFRRLNPDIQDGDFEAGYPYKTQQCSICRQTMPYDGHHPSSFCSRECEEIDRESSRSYQINEQKRAAKEAFKQKQLDRMKELQG